MQTRHLNHSTYQLQYHIVWGTKHRRKWLKDYVRDELRKSFADTAKKYPTLVIKAMNTNDDHVHLQIELPPTIAIADAVQKLKGASSIAIQKRFKFIKDMYIEWDGIWSVGYFVSSVGLDEANIERYIAWQGKQEVKPQTPRLFR